MGGHKETSSIENYFNFENQEVTMQSQTIGSNTISNNVMPSLQLLYSDKVKPALQSFYNDYSKMPFSDWEQAHECKVSANQRYTYYAHEAFNGVSKLGALYVASTLFKSTVEVLYGNSTHLTAGLTVMGGLWALSRKPEITQWILDKLNKSGQFPKLEASPKKDL